MISRAHKWLFCTAWHNSVEIAAPGQSSLSRRKHRRLRGDASRKETRRPASSLSLSTELWHTNTSYFRLNRSRELRADCALEGVVPGDDDDEEQNEDADDGEADTRLTEVDADFFVASASCSRCVPDTLDLKSFWNQPEKKKSVGRYL